MITNQTHSNDTQRMAAALAHVVLHVKNFSAVASRPHDDLELQSAAADLEAVCLNTEALLLQLARGEAE